MYKISKLPFFPRFVKKVVINAAGQRSQEVSIYSAREFCHSDVIYFAHALDIANAGGSLLATPLLLLPTNGATIHSKSYALQHQNRACRHESAMMQWHGTWSSAT